MIACPQPGCGGSLDEGCCWACGKVTLLSDILGKFPPTEKVVRVQEDKLDYAEREGGG